MESGLLSILPVCPYCSRSLQSREPFQLHCCHLLCGDCVSKIQTSEGCYRCVFDLKDSKELYRPGPLSWLQGVISEAVRTPEELICALDWELGYMQKELPCPFPSSYCKGNCGCDHSCRFKAFECPLKANCPTMSSCIFAHYEVITLPSMQHPFYATMQQESMETRVINPPVQQSVWGVCSRCQYPQGNCRCAGY